MLERKFKDIYLNVSVLDLDARILDGIKAYQDYERKVALIIKAGGKINDAETTRLKEEFTRVTAHFTERELGAIVRYALARRVEYSKTEANN